MCPSLLPECCKSYQQLRLTGQGEGMRAGEEGEGSWKEGVKGFPAAVRLVEGKTGVGLVEVETEEVGVMGWTKKEEHLRI